MSVDRETVRRIAHLARIELPEERVAPLETELNQILGWVEQLAEVDTENVPPMTSVVDMSLKRRADAVTDGGYAEDVTRNAPACEYGFFVVPKVVE